MPGLTVTIDGPAGAGKSSVARRLADRLGLAQLDTGAMYRALTLVALRLGHEAESGGKLKAIAERTKIRLSPGQVIVDGDDVTLAIRSLDVDRWVSRVAAHPEVRSHMLSLQRDLAREGGLVIEGRDAGTVIAPQAQVKFFLTATLKARTLRRARDMERRGVHPDPAELEADLAERDREDRERAVAPLQPADDAVCVDTTDLTEDQVVDRLEALVRERQTTAGVAP